GRGLAGDEDLEHAVLDEQLGKAFGVRAVVRIRVPRDDLLDGKLVFDAHRLSRASLLKYAMSVSGKFTVMPSAPPFTTWRISSSVAAPHARTTKPSACRR